MKNRYLVGFVAFTLVVGALLIFGVCTHTEAGLMEICWTERGQALYGDSDCSGREVEPIRWDHVPIIVGVRSYIDDAQELARAERIAASEAQLWNTQLGFSAFRISTEESPDVTIVWGTPTEVGETQEGGAVSHLFRGNRLTADVTISAIAIDSGAARVTFHELGHVLGLAHDDFEDSPMFPTMTMSEVRDPSTGIPNLPFQRVTDGDRVLLRGIYLAD